MTWREKTVARILLIVAKMVARDPATVKDIEQLSSHISVGVPKAEGEQSGAFLG